MKAAGTEVEARQAHVEGIIEVRAAVAALALSSPAFVTGVKDGPAKGLIRMALMRYATVPVGEVIETERTVPVVDSGRRHFVTFSKVPKWVAVYPRLAAFNNALQASIGPQRLTPSAVTFAERKFCELIDKAYGTYAELRAAVAA